MGQIVLLCPEPLPPQAETAECNCLIGHLWSKHVALFENPEDEAEGYKHQQHYDNPSPN